jgi:hypothetical protein
VREINDLIETGTSDLRPSSPSRPAPGIQRRRPEQSGDALGLPAAWQDTEDRFVRLEGSEPGGRADAATCAEMIEAIRAIETVDCDKLVMRIEHLVECLAHEQALFITIEEGSAGVSVRW